MKPVAVPWPARWWWPRSSCPPATGLPGLDDSKRLNVSTRERLFEAILHAGAGFSVQVVEVDEIDRLNILQATLRGYAAGRWGP